MQSNDSVDSQQIIEILIFIC